MITGLNVEHYIIIGIGIAQLVGIIALWSGMIKLNKQQKENGK